MVVEGDNGRKEKKNERWILKEMKEERKRWNRQEKSERKS